MTRRRNILLTAVAVALAFGTSACDSKVLDAPSGAQISADDKEKKRPRVKLESVTAVAGSSGDPFSGINPCVKVRRGLYKRSLAGKARRDLSFEFSYLSRGQRVTKTAVVKIADTKLIGPDPESKRYMRVDTTIDVDAPIDVGSPIDTNLSLVKIKKKEKKK